MPPLPSDPLARRRFDLRFRLSRRRMLQAMSRRRGGRRHGRSDRARRSGRHAAGQRHAQGRRFLDRRHRRGAGYARSAQNRRGGHSNHSCAMSATRLSPRISTASTCPDWRPPGRFRPTASTWDFTLRTDVTFHDGTPLDANAVKASLDRIIDPATKSAGAKSALGPVDERDRDRPERRSAQAQQALRAAARRTHQRRLHRHAQPTAVRARPPISGASRSALDPFMVDEWVSSDHITLKKNPNYKWAPGYLHQGDAAFLDTLTFRIMVEDASRPPRSRPARSTKCRCPRPTSNRSSRAPTNTGPSTICARAWSSLSST